MLRFLQILSTCVAIAAVCPVHGQSVIINEIMFHPQQPAFGPEPVGEEYLELFNRGTNAVDLNGWRLDRGVSFTFSNVTLAAGDYLVVVANQGMFFSRYPELINVVGDWAGTLANNGEEIRLVDAAGNIADSVAYASQGDWAARRHGPNDLNHRGWKWHAPADGLGQSLQRRNPFLPGSSGQNWAAADPTPGQVNGCFTNDLAPLILDVAHSPLIPKSTQPVFVTARLLDESATNLAATLFYRNDAVTPPPFAAAPMADDGLHGDGVAADGIYGAAIPAQAHNTVVEFYVEAVDAGGRTNLWPTPPLAALDETNQPPRAPCALYQVDDAAYAGSQPLHKLIMIESERMELAGIPCSDGQNSNAEMNGTFLSVEGTGVECRYLCGFRNRGHHTRCTEPPNYRVNFPNDRLWKGQRALNLNSEASYVQVFGAAIAKKAGVPGYDSRAAQVRVNNANLALPSTGMFGSYAANEVEGAAFAEHHFPLDPDGNLYRVNREPLPADFVWRGDDPAAYTNTYAKATHKSENDWSDLIGLHRILGATDLFTPANARAVANIEEWMLHLAVMALFADGAGVGTVLNTGYNDDYCLYCGVADPRFILMYHDLGGILGVLDPDLGQSTTNLDIFSCTWNNGTGAMMGRLIHSPEFEPIYYATLQRLIDTAFSEAEFNALVDQTFAGYPQTSQLTSMIGNLKKWMSGRRAYVQSAIAGHVPPATNPPIASISGEPRSPTPFTGATLTVGGANITHYKYRLNAGTWSAERAVATPIQFFLPNGSTNMVSVVGRNAAGAYQSTNAPTVSRAWVVNTNLPPVRLNEVLARNDAAVNHHGTFPDLIELYNEGAMTVDLSGLRLTDDLADPNKFVFPENTTLAAGDFLVLCANNPDGTPGFHLGFTLNQDGDAVHLLDRATNGDVALDSVVFGLQVPDRSIGRLGQSGEWVLTQPTFGAANLAQSLGLQSTLKINEWLASGALPFADDFLELYNPDPLPVALGGLFLSDEPIGAPALHPIAALSFIAGSGHCVFLADGNAGSGANHLSFRLSADMGEISLNARDLSRIDYVNYGPQVTGASQGRCPDGDLKLTTLTQPTPGYANFCPGPAPGPRLVNVVPITNVWRFNQTSTNLGSAWKEMDYDDSSWTNGAALLGRLRDSPFAFVPEPILTPLSVGTVMTYYFRTHFTMAPDASFPSLQISNVIDDGAVFYVNGVELAARFNMPTGTVSAVTPASSSIVDAKWQGPITVPTNLVRAGDNVLAVEVHQYSLSSTDVMFGLRLDGVIATTPQTAAVVINEVLANNATVALADGATPDWVEIYNPSTNTVDLGNTSLSDSPADPRRWVFPSPTLMAPRSFLVIRFDPNAPASASNTGFGLKLSGASLYLFNNPAFGSNIIDSVSFGLQTPDFAIGRFPDGRSNSWRLTWPTAGAANVSAPLGDPANLMVNEWMAMPASGEDWFEIFNPNAQPVALGGLWLSDDLGSSTARMKYRIPALSFLGCVTNAFQRFHADKRPEAGADHVNFKLDGTDGDSIGISAADGALIHGVSFGPQAAGVSEGFLPDGATNLVCFPVSASPGEANYLPLTNIVINEVLAHSDLPLEDAIELLNLTGSPIDLGGWYLSDSKANLRKYLIPNETMLPENGFKVFYEHEFNSPDFPTTAFALSSAEGDQVYLSQAVNGQLTGYRTSVKFGPSESGVSFGRYPTSVGVDFVAMSALSFGSPVTALSPTNQLDLFRTGQGAPNPYPRVGPVIISQIMYHPPDIVWAGTTNDSVVEEFVELRNITASAVPLYDPAHATNGWRLRDAVDFHFNASHSLPPGGHLLVVSFDPTTNLTALAAFRAAYGSNAALAGPYSGKLDNGGESVELAKPDAPLPDGSVPYVLVEKVVYQDHAPWPTNADGHGDSLQRVSASGYANDPTNWIAAAPVVGAPSVPDHDGDGLPDPWEAQFNFDPENAADAAQDADGDGLSNLDEYLSGTDPRDPQSYLKVECPGVAGGQVMIQFVAVAWRTYTVQYRETVESGPWLKLADVSAQPVTQVVTILDPANNGPGARFYRLVTPAVPGP